MPQHATERSLSVNALKKRSAGKSITLVLSPNRLSEWLWESMVHSLKQGILGRAKGISLRFSLGASRHRKRGGEAFAVVRDLDPYAKRRVQAILRRCGRGQDTDLRILSDGEDGLRGVVGTWFGKKCQHRLDWFHVARRIARIEKEFLYLPYGDDFQERLAAHWAHLNSMKWMLWNDGVDMAEFGMTRVRIGLFQHALAHPEANSERFESRKYRSEARRASFLFVCEP